MNDPTKREEFRHLISDLVFNSSNSTKQKTSLSVIAMIGKYNRVLVLKSFSDTWGQKSPQQENKSGSMSKRNSNVPFAIPSSRHPQETHSSLKIRSKEV